MNLLPLSAIQHLQPQKFKLKKKIDEIKGICSEININKMI